MSEQAIYFYTRHPISAAIILTKLREARGHLDDVRPDELFAHDQDHYGGLAANDALAVVARVGQARASRISAPASAARRATLPIATARTSPASS
jgi:hypothetical protein